MPLFLAGNTAQPYYLVDVRGEGQYPRLKFDTKECIMPPVPLGFTSRAQFYVISQGYDNLQLKVYSTPSQLTASSHVAEVIALQHHTVPPLPLDVVLFVFLKSQWRLTVACRTFLPALGLTTCLLHFGGHSISSLSQSSDCMLSMNETPRMHLLNSWQLADSHECVVVLRTDSAAT